MYHYQKNIGDYRSATMHLSLLEHGVYNQLLDWYYLEERPLPSDNRTLFRRLSAKSEIEQQAVVDVLEEMFIKTDEGWIHKRIEREITLYKAKAEQARAAGKLGGRPSKNGIGSIKNRDGFEKEAVAKPTKNQEPITNNQEPKSSSSSQIMNPALARGDDEKPRTPAEWLEVFAQQHGVDVDHRSFHDRKKFWPLAAAWSNAGVTVGQMRQACAKAHAEAKGPIAWLPAYADRVLASMQAERSATARPQQGETFAERDRENGMRRWEQMTGQVHPDRVRKTASVIDVAEAVEVLSPLQALTQNRRLSA